MSGASPEIKLRWWDACGLTRLSAMPGAAKYLPPKSAVIKVSASSVLRDSARSGVTQTRNCSGSAVSRAATACSSRSARCLAASAAA